MGRSLLSVLILLTMTFYVSGKLDIEEILEDIPENEQLEFLRYHVNRGYELGTSQKPGNHFNYPDEFSVKLYKYFLKNRPVTNEEIKKLTTCVICWPDGKCVDLCDPGIHP